MTKQRYINKMAIEASGTVVALLSVFKITTVARKYVLGSVCTNTVFKATFTYKCLVAHAQSG